MDYEKKLKELADSYGEWWNKGFPVPEMTDKLYPYSSMFEPIQVNKLKLKNRLVMAPMGNIDMCEETGRPNEKMLKYFEERARGGVGLITTGLIPVSFGIDKSLIELDDLTYFPRIDRSRTRFSAWRDLAGMCHAHGSAIFIQLTAGLGRVGNPQCLVNQFAFPRSASLNPNWYMKEVPCLPLTDRRIKKIIKNIGQGAADAKAANLDGVYLHGHEGYLMEQLTNRAFNRRKLGRFSNYENFGLDTIRMIRKRVGPDFPIMYRIDLSLLLNATYKGRMKNTKPLKKFRKERTAQQTLVYMKHLVEAGVDMFDVDLGCYDNWWLPHPPSSMPSGCFLDVSEIVKKYFKDNNVKSNKGLPVPVVAVGKLGYPDLAEKALRDGKCDMVMLGRPLLADADWCNKAYAGRVRDIRPCIGCQEGCLNEFVEGGHPQCAVNPRTAFEEEYPREIPLAKVKKKVAVIGAGPAGVTAAEVLAARGHSVDLYERQDRVGGNVAVGSAPVIKYEIKNYLKYLENRVETLEKEGKIKVFMNAAPSAEELKAKGYDVIITATGSRQVKPKIEGIDGENVVYAVDVLKNPALLDGAENIVVVGGGVGGAETAYFLAYEHGKKVSVIEMDKFIMNHTCTANRGHIIHYLEEKGVKLFNCTKLSKVEKDGVAVERNMHKNVPDPYNTWAPILPENVINPMEKKIKPQFVKEKIKCDKVVLAMGVAPENALFYQLMNDNAAAEIYNLGDSFKGGKVFEAVRSAYRKAVSI